MRLVSSCFPTDRLEVQVPDLYGVGLAASCSRALMKGLGLDLEKGCLECPMLTALLGASGRVEY